MKPKLNVTPLIDVLLVLLIIFMVISPIAPSQFETKLPGEDKDPNGESSPLLLVARINKDLTLSLNGWSEVGTVDDTAALSGKLKEVFAERTKNKVLNESMVGKQGVPDEDLIQKTVFIRAPRGISYGQVVKIIDVVKGAGANPISLQLDDLE